VGIIEPTEPEPLFQQADQIELGPSDAQPKVVAEVPIDGFSHGSTDVGETELGVPIPVADPFATSPASEPTGAPANLSPPPSDRTAGGLVLPEGDPFR